MTCANPKRTLKKPNLVLTAGRAVVGGHMWGTVERHDLAYHPQIVPEWRHVRNGSHLGEPPAPPEAYKAIPTNLEPMLWYSDER